MKERLDKLMVARSLAPSREKAQALILAGKVLVERLAAPKAGSRVAETAHISVTGKEHPYVSRGGVKLEAALKGFQVDPAGLTVLDIGASTGGFTHCLLTMGAARVFAVDVGYGQLAWQLRNDPRVVVMERTNIRKLPAGALDAPVALVVVDVSFISLAKVLGDALRFLEAGGLILGLVKPQFEAGRDQVGRGGTVKDPAVHRQVLAQVGESAAALGLTLLGLRRSPITGKKSGNVEFFALWRWEPAA
ncbi:MAG: TlyA family RNA methyltransferase [bacterium]